MSTTLATKTRVVWTSSDDESVVARRAAAAHFITEASARDRAANHSERCYERNATADFGEIGLLSMLDIARRAAAAFHNPKRQRGIASAEPSTSRLLASGENANLGSNG